MNAPAAVTPPYKHTPLFPLGKDTTTYRKLTSDGVRVEKAFGQEFVVVEQEALRALAEAAFVDINHLLRPGHLASLQIDRRRPGSERQRQVRRLRLPQERQHRGRRRAADVPGHRHRHHHGQEGPADLDRRATTRPRSRRARATPISSATCAIRSSRPSPCSRRGTRARTCRRRSRSTPRARTPYKLLFIAKGGGSANKSFLFQATPSILTHDRLIAFLKEKVLTLGTAACPPYHLAIVIGGTSAELTLKTVKLASAAISTTCRPRARRTATPSATSTMEQEVHKLTQSLGVGAQFGGKYFCHDVRVIRLPRHGASLPIGLGVSCSADRQALGKITREGVFLEELERNPAKYLPEVDTDEARRRGGADRSQQADAGDPRAAHADIRSRRGSRSAGPMIVARDLAHSKLRERLEQGQGLPDYFKNHPVYYAGPAKTPDGYASGAFGPTTAGRMDSFIEQFQALGGSLVSVAKGNRSSAVREACHKHGGFYLASIGGAAANLAEHCIKKVEVKEYPELGMEAIWRIEVVDFPAFIVIDDKGNDFFKELNLG